MKSSRLPLLRRMCRDIFISKTTPFIWGLLLSQSFAEFGVVKVLMKDLTNLLGGNLRKSAIVVNLQDGLSSILAIVIHILVSHVGHFSVIIFSTACYVTGLMIFWLSAWTSKHVSMFYGAAILMALGNAGNYVAGIFLKHQFKEKLKYEEQSRDENEEQKEINPEQQMGDEKRDSGDRNQKQEIGDEKRERGDRNSEERKIRDHENEIEGINPEERENEEDKKESRKIHREKRDSGDRNQKQEIGDEKRERGDRNSEERKMRENEIVEINPEERENEEDKKESRKIHREKQTDEKKGRESGDYKRPEINPYPLEKRVNISFDILKGAASISGTLINSLLPKKSHYPNNYKIGALLMGATYLLFYSGSFCYSFGEPQESPLYKICRVFKAALGKRDLEYPASSESYYRNNGDYDNEGDFSYRSDGPDFCCIKTRGSIRLIPRVPSLWRFLDKAAIKREIPDFSPERQVQEGQLCTVKEVSEVKHLSSLIHLSLMFFPYSLVLAAGKIFFVEQASHMKSDFQLFFLFLFQSLIKSAVIQFYNTEIRRKRNEGEEIRGKRSKKKIFQGKNATIVRIGAGIVCAVLCCIAAWQVELHRLSLTKKEGDKISMSTAVLIPQFLLLGLMQGFAEKGLKIYYSARMPKSMDSFLEPLRNVMFGMGKLLTIPFIFIFHGWIKDSINNSRVDRYFLLLANLNILSLCLYVYYSLRYACKQDFPEDQESTELMDPAL